MSRAKLRAPDKILEAAQKVQRLWVLKLSPEAFSTGTKPAEACGRLNRLLPLTNLMTR